MNGAGFHGAKPFPILPAGIFLDPGETSDEDARRYPVVYSRTDDPDGPKFLLFEEDGDELIIHLGDREDIDDAGLRIDKLRALQVAEGLRQWAVRA